MVPNQSRRYGGLGGLTVSQTISKIPKLKRETP